MPTSRSETAIRLRPGPRPSWVTVRPRHQRRQPVVTKPIGASRLSDDLVAANDAPSWIWGHQGLRRLPAGFGPGGPTRLWPVLTARVLSPSGMLRAGVEPLVPTSRTTGDRSVGDYLDRRFGRQLTDRLVDPLLGGLHAGDVRRLSLAAATPQLAALAAERRSLLLRRRPPASGRATSVTLRGGMVSFPTRLARDLDLDGVEVRRGSAAVRLARDGDRLRLDTSDGWACTADGVVLAIPAAAARRLLVDPSPDAAEGLEGLRAASVVVVVLVYPAHTDSAAAFAGTGVLVPSSQGRLLKAATFLTSKWPHHATAGRVLVRASAGRIGDPRAFHLDDSALVERLHDEVCDATGLRADPSAAHLQRWPSTMPQLEVGHHRRLAGIGRALRRDLPGVVLAGAPYHGPGIAACVRSGTDAADRIADELQERAR